MCRRIIVYYFTLLSNGPAKIGTHVYHRLTYDFVCCRGGFRVPDQVIATTVIIIIIYSSIGITIITSITSVCSDNTGTGKIVTAAGTTTVATADRRPAGR